MKEAKFAASKQDFQSVLDELGAEDTHNVGEPLFYIVLESPLDAETDYLVTVAVDGKTYGLTRPHGGDYASDKLIYFSLTDGAQIDFVNGVRKSNNANAKKDLSDFEGQATVSLYKTNAQQPGVYPTGLELIKQEAIQLSRGA